MAFASGLYLIAGGIDGIVAGHRLW